MNFLLAFLLSFNIVSVQTLEVGGRDYITLKEIISKFNFKLTRGERGFIADGHRFAYFPQTGTYILDDEKGRLDFVSQEGEVFIVGELWAHVLSKVIEGNVYWDYEKDRFILSRYPPSIKGIQIKRSGDSLLIILKLNPELEVNVERGDGLLKVNVLKGFYRGPYRFEGDRILADSLYITHTSRGAEILIYIRRGVNYRLRGSGAKRWIVLKGPPLQTGVRRKIDCIVIDPGHGGKDPGAVGRRGTREKDIVLMIAKKVKKILEKRTGLKVYLTRDRDEFVPLRERALFANRIGADLFVSIHCNYSRKRSAEGIETYFLSEAKTQWERAVAAFENSAIKYELENNVDTSDILKYILMDMAQTEFLKESQDLAAFIQESLVRKTRRIDRGVKQAGFYVLAGAYMPAVLVEVSFISNPAEEKLLRSKNYQEKIAKGIADGIEKFVRVYAR